MSTHFHGNILLLFGGKVTFVLEYILKGFIGQKHRSLDTFYTTLLNNQFIYKNSGIFLSFEFIPTYSVLALPWKYTFLNWDNIASSCLLNVQLDTAVNGQYQCTTVR